MCQFGGKNGGKITLYATKHRDYDCLVTLQNLSLLHSTFMLKIREPNKTQLNPVLCISSAFLIPIFFRFICIYTTTLLTYLSLKGIGNFLIATVSTSISAKANP